MKSGVQRLSQERGEAEQGVGLRPAHRTQRCRPGNSGATGKPLPDTFRASASLVRYQRASWRQRQVQVSPWWGWELLEEGGI